MKVFYDIVEKRVVSSGASAFNSKHGRKKGEEERLELCSTISFACGRYIKCCNSMKNKCKSNGLDIDIGERDGFRPMCKTINDS